MPANPPASIPSTAQAVFNKPAAARWGRCIAYRKEITIKTYLKVPFEEKYLVRRLGARWDPARKRWFVPDGTDLTPFLPWVPDLPKLSRGVKRVLRDRC